MTDALSLDDATVSAQLAEPEAVQAHVDPWLARRALTWGASEIATLLVALGMRHAEDFPDRVRKSARVVRGRRSGVKAPRIFLVKAGLEAEYASNGVADTGKARERELFRQWRERVRRGIAGRDASSLDPSSLVWALDVLPIEAQPFVDRRCPALSMTPDAWARDVLGGLVMVDTKCSVHAYGAHETRPGVQPHHVLQLHGQMAVWDADHGLVVEGEQWGARWRDDGGEPMGPIVTWPVPRDEALIGEIRKACALGWERVEELRAQREEAAA